MSPKNKEPMQLASPTYRNAKLSKLIEEGCAVAAQKIAA
jgi:hypothetical protein